MNRNTPGLPAHHQLPESMQTHAHWVGDAIQPSHPPPAPSPPAPNPSMHQGLFQWVNSSHEVAKVLEFQLQHQSLFRTDLLEDGLVGSPCSPRDSQESSPTPQFKSINFSPKILEPLQELSTWSNWERLQAQSRTVGEESAAVNACITERMWTRDGQTRVGAWVWAWPSAVWMAKLGLPSSSFSY